MSSSTTHTGGLICLTDTEPGQAIDQLSIPNYTCRLFEGLDRKTAIFNWHNRFKPLQYAATQGLEQVGRRRNNKKSYSR